MRRRHLIIVMFERRSKSDRFLKHFDCFLVLARALVCLAQMKVRIGIIRLLLSGLFQQTDRRSGNFLSMM